MSDIDLAEAARIAERLAENLSRTATDPGWAAGALNDLAKLAKLRTVLEGRHREYLAAAIPAAVGNAATHDWRVSDGGADLVCNRCESLGTPSILRDGQTPPCPDRCQAFGSDCGHSLYPVYDTDTSNCIYCKTVYPTTAEVPVSPQGVKQ